MQNIQLAEVKSICSRYRSAATQTDSIPLWQKHLTSELAAIQTKVACATFVCVALGFSLWAICQKLDAAHKKAYLRRL